MHPKNLLFASILLSLLGHAAHAANEPLAQARQAVQERNYAEAEVLLTQHIASVPSDADNRFLLARVLSWQNKFDAARREYQILLAKEPDNSDYLFGLAQTYVWVAQPAPALPLLAQARARNRADSNILRLEIMALVAMADPVSLDKALALQELAQAQFPTESWAIAKPTPAAITSGNTRGEHYDKTGQSQLELRLSDETLSSNSSRWKSTRLDWEHRFGPRQVVYASLADVERFELKDQLYLAGLYQPLNERWLLNAEVTYSPSQRVVEKQSAMASLQYSAAPGWSLIGGMKNAAYQLADANQVFGRVEHYVRSFLLGYTLTSTSTRGTAVNNQRFQIAHYYTDTSFIRFNYSLGEEAELSQRDTWRFNTRFHGLNGRHWMNPDWAVTWEIGRTSQENFTRTGVSIGLRRAF